MKNCYGCNRLENQKFICPKNCPDAEICENEVTKIKYEQIKMAPK